MAGLENIGNLWDQLSELHQKDPQKYQEVIEESAKEYAKLKLPPLPHTCILVREKVILKISLQLDDLFDDIFFLFRETRLATLLTF